MKLITLASLLATVTFLAACAQPEPEPAPIMPEPTYDKYGNPVE